MIDILLDPRFINFIVLVLFFLCTIRWLVEGEWGHAVYWGSAFALNCVVTFKYQN